MIAVIADHKVREICAMIASNRADMGFWGHPLCFCVQHDPGPVGIIRADKVGFMTLHALEPDKNVRLHMLQHMPEMNRAVCVR